jgi:tetratricopeptide (TPR) repeat protein
LKLGRNAVDLAARARLSNNLGILFEEQAHLKRARSYYARAFEIFSEIGHRRNRAYCLGNLANIDRHTGRFDSAREGYEEVLRETMAIGEAHAHAYTLGNLGDLYADFGDFDHAAPYYRRTLAFARRAADDELQAETLLRMAVLARHAGKSELFAQQVTAAAELAHRAGSEEFQIKAALLADAYPVVGEDSSAAITRLQDTLQRAQRARLILYQILAHETLARRLAGAGEHRHALRHAAQGLANARKVGFVLCEIRLHLLSASIRTVTVDADRGIRRFPDRARKHLDAARTKHADILRSISDAPLREIFTAHPVYTATTITI